jgi:hypothetical protein
LEPKPVQYHTPPAYPTRRDVLAGAASFALVGLTGGSLVFAASEGGKITVAPVFKHGEGRGAEGCIVMTPPVFLSEEEAMQILREELAKHGVYLKAGGTLEGLRIPGWLEERKLLDKGKGKKELEETVREPSGPAKPLKLIGMDAEKKIAVEFVSERNYFKLAADSGIPMVVQFDMKGVAEFVAEQSKKHGKERVFLGVFYDPLTEMHWPDRSDGSRKTDWEAEMKRLKKKDKEESAKLLRQQAQDFVAWLKKQKAID